MSHELREHPPRQPAESPGRVAKQSKHRAVWLILSAKVAGGLLAGVLFALVVKPRRPNESVAAEAGSVVLD
jgi:hypothetical protein